MDLNGESFHAQKITLRARNDTSTGQSPEEWLHGHETPVGKVHAADKLPISVETPWRVIRALQMSNLLVNHRIQVDAALDVLRRANIKSDEYGYENSVDFLEIISKSSMGTLVLLTDAEQPEVALRGGWAFARPRTGPEQMGQNFTEEVADAVTVAEASSLPTAAAPQKNEAVPREPNSRVHPMPSPAMFVHKHRPVGQSTSTSGTLDDVSASVSSLGTDAELRRAGSTAFNKSKANVRLQKLEVNKRFYEQLRNDVDKGNDEIVRVQAERVTDSNYRPPLPTDFFSHVYIGQEHVDQLSRLLVSFAGVQSVLCADWNYSCDGECGVLFQRKHSNSYEIGFAVEPAFSKDSKTFAVFLRPTVVSERVRAADRAWIVSDIDTKFKTRSKGLSPFQDPVRQLGYFASFGEGDQGRKMMLDTLARAAFPERWNFTRPDIVQHSASVDKNILYTYLNLTFHRLKMEGKIVVDRNRGFVVFNTGLVTAQFDEIYCCLIKNIRRIGWQPWLFGCFCMRNKSMDLEGSTYKNDGIYIYKNVKRHCEVWPRPAQYVSVPSQLIFKRSVRSVADLSINYEHLICDHVDRFSAEYLWDILRDEPTIHDRWPQRPENNFEGDPKARKSFMKLASSLVHNQALTDKVRRTLDEAINRAISMVQIDYRRAVPVYYPREGTVNMLLPLCLSRESSDSAPDLVLVLADIPSGYDVRTKFTPQMAYELARQISRITEGWLATQTMADPSTN